MYIIINILVFIGAFVLMECAAWFMHKYVMHGFGWFLHKSHHVPQKGKFELNDLYPIIFAIPAFLLMLYGSSNFDWRFWLGSGMTFYGMCYFLFHDIIVHRRFGHKVITQNKYLKRIIRAHKIHHKHLGKEEGEAFGFLFSSKSYHQEHNNKVKEYEKNIDSSQ